MHFDNLAVSQNWKKKKNITNQTWNTIHCWNSSGKSRVEEHCSQIQYNWSNWWPLLQMIYILLVWCHPSVNKPRQSNLTWNSIIYTKMSSSGAAFMLCVTVTLQMNRAMVQFDSISFWSNTILVRGLRHISHLLFCFRLNRKFWRVRTKQGRRESPLKWCSSQIPSFNLVNKP